MKIKILPVRSITFYTVLLLVAVITNSSNCGGDDIQINYEYGTFPDSVINLEGMNSTYDDYNMALPQIYNDIPIMFSSNRNSSGENFDFVTGYLHFIFNQFDGSFLATSEMLDAPFYDYLEDLVNTDADEYGPMRFFNGDDGYEYFFYSTDFETDNHDLKYVKYLPSGGTATPNENQEGVISVLNSSSNDAYLTIDWDIEKVYFTSDRSADYDILEVSIPGAVSLSSWLEGSPGVVSVTDSINSDYDDKCPYIMDNIMVFTSNRPGGLGGFDLYYSVMRNDKWSSPINLGPGINTEYNEYRPLAGFGSQYTNYFLLFSSDRPGGKGGYDLYFSGIDF